jgi:hypothetical protein
MNYSWSLCEILLSFSFTKKSFPYRRFPFFRSVFLICGRQWRIFNGEWKVHCTTISLIAFLYNNSFALLSLNSFALFIIDKWTIKVKSHRNILEGEKYIEQWCLGRSPSKQNILLKDLLNLATFIAPFLLIFNAPINYKDGTHCIFLYLLAAESILRFFINNKFGLKSIYGEF